MILTRDKIQRMSGDAANPTIIGGGGSGGSGGGGGSVDYAAEAGHAETADEATHATSADSATEAGKLASNSSDWAKILRKDIADTAAEVITFAKGIISTLRSYFNGGATVRRAAGDSGKALVVTGGTQTDTIDASGNASVGGTLGVSGNTTLGGTLDVTDETLFHSDIEVQGDVTAESIIADLLKTPEFIEAVGMIGLGFGVTKDANTYRATLQTDDLIVLGKMIVNTLNIREVSYIGGTYLLTPAGSEVAMVQRLCVDNQSDIPDTRQWSTSATTYNVGFRLLCRADDGTTNTMNYWQVGDQAYCQTFNLANSAGTALSNRRYWRLVVRTGRVSISGQSYFYIDLANVGQCYLYDSNGNQLTSLAGSTAFVGYEDATGSTPKEGDKVVSLGNQYDATRCGAIQISSEGEASIGIYDNIRDFTPIVQREIHYFSRSAVRMTSTLFTWRTGSTTQTQAQLVTNINQQISTAEQNISLVGKTVRGKNLLPYDAYTDFDGVICNYDYFDAENQRLFNNSDDTLYSPIIFLPAGTYCYSIYIVSSTVYLYLYCGNKNFATPASYPGDDVNIAITSVVSGDTYQGYTRKYCVFTLTTDTYVSVQPYSNDDFTGYRPQLELGSSPTAYEPGVVTKESVISQKADEIRLEVSNGLTSTGIDITNHKIVAKANNFEIQNNNGDKTFSIDADGNLQSVGNASFGGTVKAMNFYHALFILGYAQPGDASSYGIYGMVYNADSMDEWYYYDGTNPDYGTLPAGYYSAAEILAQTGEDPGTGCTLCIGLADNAVISSQMSSTSTIYLPRAADMPGKIISLDNKSEYITTVRSVNGGSNDFLYIAGSGQAASYPSENVAASKQAQFYSTGTQWLFIYDNSNYLHGERVYLDSNRYFFLDSNNVLKFDDNGTVKTVQLT